MAQNKDLDEYGSSKKTLLIFSKKEQVNLVELENRAEVDLVKMKKKKQYGYDLFSYQYINYANKKKSYIYEYKSQSYKTSKNLRII